MGKQLFEKENGIFKEIFPLNIIDNIKDLESQKTLASILTQFNNIAVPYINNKSDTRNQIPILLRRKGLWITYYLDNEYITEYFKGEANDIQNNWGDDNNWEIIPNLKYVQDNASKLPNGIITADKLSPALLQLIQSSGKVVNIADDEDIEEVNSTLKFKDRKYNSELASGKGYKILRKNWTKVGGRMINLLTQDMINESNTIYEIRYDFDLNEKEITIPENCVLKFNGGSLSNGIINYSHTIIIDSIPKISISCVCKGIIKYNEKLNIYDCGAKGNGVSDDVQAFKVARDSLSYYGGGELILGNDTFCISSYIKMDKIPSLRIIGNGASIKNITESSSLIDKYGFLLNSVLEAGSGNFPTNDYGCLIKTAKAGDNFIVVKDSSYLQKVFIGRNYKITCFCIQSNGFPYNHYNFEIITPTSIEDNKIYIKNKLKYDYYETDLDDLYDNDSWTPSARLWTGNNIAFCSDYFYMENINFLGDNRQLGSIGLQNCKNIILNSCNFQSNLAFGECDNIEIKNCIVTGMLEPDKHINICTIKNCFINNYGEGTGIKYLNIINNNINTAIRIYGFNIYIDGNVILGREIESQGDSSALVISNTTYPVNNVYIKNNLLINRYKDKTDVIVPAILLGSGCPVKSGTIIDNTLQISKTVDNLESIACHLIIGLLAYFNGDYYKITNVSYSNKVITLTFDKKIDNSVKISSSNIFYLGVFENLNIKNNQYDGWYPINSIDINAKSKVIEDIFFDDGNIIKITYKTGRRADSFTNNVINIGNKYIEKVIYNVKNNTESKCILRTSFLNVDLSTKGISYVSSDNNKKTLGNSTISGNILDFSSNKFYIQTQDINTLDDFNGEIEITLYLSNIEALKKKGHSNELPSNMQIGDLFYDYDARILKASTGTNTYYEFYPINPDWARTGSMAAAPLADNVPIGFLFQNNYNGIPCFYIGDKQYINTFGNPGNTLTFGKSNDRPTNVKKGTSYFDENLNKTIYWNGTNWVNNNGDSADINNTGTFEQKPDSPSKGFAYFCTDKQTTEGSTNGIMIYHKGGNVWVDALGRVIE